MAIWETSNYDEHSEVTTSAYYSDDLDATIRFSYCSEAFADAKAVFGLDFEKNFQSIATSFLDPRLSSIEKDYKRGKTFEYSLTFEKLSSRHPESTIKSEIKEV